MNNDVEILKKWFQEILITNGKDFCRIFRMIVQTFSGNVSSIVVPHSYLQTPIMQVSGNVLFSGKITFCPKMTCMSEAKFIKY